MSGVTARPSLALPGPADAGLPVLPPSPVTWGRPVDESAVRLGETTERLLLGHLRDRRPTVPDFARRERRLPAGHTAGALTSRTR